MPPLPASAIEIWVSRSSDSARDVGQHVLARHRPQRLLAGGEVLEEHALVDPFAWGRTYPQRQLGDHPEHALGPDEQLAYARSGGTRGQRVQVDVAGRRR